MEGLHETGPRIAFIHSSKLVTELNKVSQISGRVWTRRKNK